MTYKLLNDQQGLASGETAVALDGDAVAVRCIVKRQLHTHNAVYCATARAIDANGVTRRDAHGYEITSDYRHAFLDSQVAALGDPAIRRECLLLVLGEPCELPESEQFYPIDDALKATANIRRALATAAATHVQAPNVL